MIKFVGLIVLCLSLFYGLSHGDDEGLVYGQWGVSVGHPESTSDPAQVKTIEFGYQQSYEKIDTRVSLGGWTDKTNYQGAKNSLYVQYLVGVETRRTEGIFVAYFIGPAYISNPDSLLGTHLQFSQQLHFGIRDKRRVGISVFAGHFSNAGISRVNKGRNFVGIGAHF
jgi:hypothetical protein